MTMHDHPIHPRILARLDQTLARRLAAFEHARCAAWSSVADVLHRLLQLNETIGGPAGQGLEAECRAALRALDQFAGGDLPVPDDVDALLQRVHRIADRAARLATELPAVKATGT